MLKTSMLGIPARPVVITAWLIAAACVCLDAAAVTPPTVELPLTETERENLLQLSCQGPARVLSARRQIGPPNFVYAEIHCESREQFNGHPVAKFVQCRRAADLSWGCDAAIPTIEVRTADGRTIHVQHRDVTSQEALDIIAFLLDAPSYRDITVQPEWVVDGMGIYRTDLELLVSGPRYQFHLRTEADSGVERLSIARMSVCESDVCHALGPGER
jgi:hypothetical protein